MDKAVVIKSLDNVATCLADVRAGEDTALDVAGESRTVVFKADIPFGHKVALADIAEGEDVIKYAEVIGVASQPIEAGDHVHVHNVESIRARGDLR
ncbi:MAG: Altronate dehydratase [Alphaproteobacteria bacterium MarineAlpha4_Bin2]|nr:MAG: Altronate dehydratase [Alphaproteobacteria bacterium MarineAlpha4_Bin2]